MSVESAIKFLTKVKFDEAFRNKLDSAKPEERVVMARAAGFMFSRDDYEKAVALIETPKSAELSDADLERVAGGIGGQSLQELLAGMGGGFSGGMAYGGSWLPDTFPGWPTPGDPKWPGQG